jgi:hypothetical protein
MSLSPANQKRLDEYNRALKAGELEPSERRKRKREKRRRFHLERLIDFCFVQEKRIDREDE